MKTRSSNRLRDRLMIVILVGVLTTIILGAVVKKSTVNHMYYTVQLDHETSSQLLNESTKETKYGTYYGIDISHWNGHVLTDLSKKDSLTFVICKATQGIDFVNTDYKTNRSFIKESGWIGGAYHFYDFGQDPVRQADHFIAVVGELGQKSMSPILDIEQASLPKDQSISVARLHVDLLIFLDALEAHYGRTPIVYTDLNFANVYLANPLFARYPLWLAEYSKSVEPQVPKTWVGKGYLIWQKTDHYSIDSHWTDFDVFTGIKEHLYR